MKKSSARKGNKTLFWWLQRRSNGVEQINYDAASSSSSSFAEDLSDSSSFITPSLEFPNRTSFVFRESEFEMDQTLDDLAISFERNDHNVPAQDLSEAGPSGAVVDDDIENFSTSVRRDGGMVGNKLGIKRIPTILVKSKGYLVPSDAVAIDLQGSSWDFLTHFAPKSETNKRPSFSFSTDSRSDEEEVETKIKYDAASSCNSSAEDYFSDSTSSFITPSLEFPDRTSFVFRKNEFEMDPLPEDFTISFDDNSEHSEVFASGGSIITSWQKGQLLGRGSFCSVYEGFSGDGDFFAVKEVSLLDKGCQAQECIKQLEGEIALLSQLQHQNIVRYRGTAKDGSNLYIFLELVTQGCLLKLYQRYQRLQDYVVSGYTRQILDGLTYLHYKGFIHRDIKCANILVAANEVVKLADFGLAKVSTLNE